MPLVANYGDSSDDSDGENQSGASTSPGPTPRSSIQLPPVQPSTSKGIQPDDDVLEDFVKKTNYGEKLPEKPAPKPLTSEVLSKMRLSNAKGKVKISIPKLQNDDSDDESQPAKKLKVANEPACFLGSLPAPRNSFGGKETNRALIPHTLTKKPSEPKPTAKTSKTMKKNVSSIGNRTISRHAAYSDSDEEMEVTSLHPQAPANNFFSLDTESNSKLTNSTSDDSTSIPLMFSSSATVHVNSQMGQQKQQPMVTAASLYNMMDQPDDVPYGEDESVDMQAEQTDLLSSDEFLKLQGKKQRGREEINIIDVNTDDMKASELELTKNLSEEVGPVRRGGGGFSGQQKRKHQITYLAFQAKQRELELKNTWAANRQTRQQTQAKYGF